MFARVGLVVLLATAIAAAALATCLPPPTLWLAVSAAFFTAFAVVAVLWALFCDPKPCHWLLLVTGQAMYAAGLLLANVIGCCTTLGYVGAGLAVAGVLVMIIWKESCGFDWCVVVEELAFVTVGVLAQIFVALATFCGTPGFSQDPVPATVWAAMNAAGVAFVAAGIACLASTGFASRLSERDRRRLTEDSSRPVFPESR